MMDDKNNEIPVLTEVYGSEPVQPVLSPAFFEYAIAQLKPHLDKAIAESLVDAQQKILEESTNFADKTKADLATEIPLMYQARAEIFQADLNAQLMQIQEQALAEMRALVEQTKQDFEAAMKGEVPELEQLLKDRVHQAFAGELPNMRQEISDRVNGEIEALIHSVRLVIPNKENLS